MSQEVQRVIAALGNPERFEGGRLSGTVEEQAVATAKSARESWGLVEPFCHSLQVAARWGSPDTLGPWVSGLRALAGVPHKIASGITELLDLRHLPAVAAITAAGLACTAASRWDNLGTLVVDPRVPDRHSNHPVHLLEATDPYQPYRHAELAASTVARASVEGDDEEVAVRHFTENRGGKYYTPVAEWIHAVLRPAFADQLPDEQSYSTEFDRADMLGLLAQDIANRRYAADPEINWRPGSQWFGRSTWRSAHSYGHPVADYADELELKGDRWAPLQGGSLRRQTGSRHRGNQRLLRAFQAHREQPLLTPKPFGVRVET